MARPRSAVSPVALAGNYQMKTPTHAIVGRRIGKASSPQMGRRVLITQQFLTGWSGTETATRDLAIGLIAQGCSPVVYTLAAGASAAALRDASIPVVEDLDLIGEP